MAKEGVRGKYGDLDNFSLSVLEILLVRVIIVFYWTRIRLFGNSNRCQLWRADLLNLELIRNFKEIEQGLTVYED